MEPLWSPVVATGRNRSQSSRNVEWRRVRSLVQAVGTVEEERDGRLRITLGGETETSDRPHGKDVDAQMLVALRRMLRRADITS
jgi:ribosomal protein S19E (S16A)